MSILTFGSGGGADLSDADATVANVLTGKKFFSSASDDVQTGTMASMSGATSTASASANTSNTSATGYQRLTIPASGYYDTSSKLQVVNSTLAANIGLTAAKLVTGNTVLGIAGTGGATKVATSYGSGSALITFTFDSTVDSSAQLCIMNLSFIQGGYLSTEGTIIGVYHDGTSTTETRYLWSSSIGYLYGTGTIQRTQSGTTLRYTSSTNFSANYAAGMLYVAAMW